MQILTCSKSFFTLYFIPGDIYYSLHPSWPIPTVPCLVKTFVKIRFGRYGRDTSISLAVEGRGLKVTGQPGLCSKTHLTKRKKKKKKKEEEDFCERSPQQSIF
jgi:hypothetical protein